MNKNLYSRLIGYTFKHKGLFFLSIVGFFLFAAADISAVEWLKQVIAYINESSTNSFNPLNLAAFLGFIAIIRGIAMFFQIRQVSKISLSISVDIQIKLTKQLITADLDELNKLSSGNHVSRIMNDVILIRDGFERTINNLVRDTFTVIALLFYLIWLDWLLSILVIVIYPLA